MRTISRHVPWMRFLILFLIALLALPAGGPARAAGTADLGLAKTVDNATPGNGSQVVFTLTVANNGPDAATGVTVSDALPAGLVYVSDDGAGAYDGATWVVGELLANASASLHITATVSAANGTSISNTATVTSDAADPEPANDAATATLTVTNYADLSLTKTVNNPSPLDGSTVVFTLTVTNLGPNDATGVSVSDSLPAGLTLSSSTGPGTYDGAAWTVGDLASGSSASLEIAAVVDPNSDGVTLANTASASAAEQDLNPANNSATATLTVAINDLCARPGSLTLPDGQVATIYGFAVGDCTDNAPAQLPGPTLTAAAGAPFTLTLHNGLSEQTSLFFHGQEMLPDLTGAAPGASQAYTFTPAAPGTYLYEAGPLPGAQHQVAMGLHGALVIRPAAAPNQAFDDAATAFDQESVLVFSEIDPALNNDPSPAGFDLRAFAPRYFLINGKAFPETASLAVVPGQKVLLRYVNAGMAHRTLALLGLSQRVLSDSGNRLPYSHRAGVKTLAAGQSADVLVEIPASALPGQRYPLYDASLLLHNNGARRADGRTRFGGMLAFLEIPDGAPGGDLAGPAISGISLSPNPANGQADVSLAATASDAAAGGSAIAAAEYFVGAPGASGAGVALQPADLAFDSPVESLAATLLASELAALPGGSHSIYLHAQDSAGNWGPFNFAVLNLDKIGPTTGSIRFTPPVSAGNLDVAIQATGDDSASGNSNLVAAEYFIDTPGADGSGQAMALNQSKPVASLTATIPAGTMGTLAEGVHTLYIHSQDALGNWGSLATADLPVDQSGPDTSFITLYPNPNNGTLGVNPSTASVRVNALVMDAVIAGVNASVATAEGFIDTVGNTGTGFPFTPTDGLFDSPMENAYAFIPLSTVNALAEGPHTVSVRGKDAAGNWGALGSATLTIDKTRPTVSAVSASPNPTAGAASITLTASASDAGGAPSNIAAAEWFVGADPGLGKASPMSAADGAFDSPTEALTATIAVNAWSAGNHTLNARAREAASNWSTLASVVVVVQPPDLIFADSFESGGFTAWSLATGAGISVTPAAAMGTDGGTLGMQATVAGNTPGYVTDNSPINESSYHARFYFNPNGTRTGNTQQDIFNGRNAAGTVIFRIQYRRTNAGGGTYQVRAGVLRAGGQSLTSWFTISNAAHAIEIDWQSAASATFRLYIDGQLRQTLSGLNTNAYRLDSIRLGPSAGLANVATGSEYFDAFVSKRFSYIGP